MNNDILLVSTIFDMLSTQIFIDITLKVNENKYVNFDDAAEIYIHYISYFINNGGMNNFEFNKYLYPSNINYVVAMNNILNENKNKKKLFIDIKKNIKKTFDDEINKKYKLKILKRNDNNYDGDLDMTENALDKINIDDDDYVGEKNNNYLSDLCIRIACLGVYFYKESQHDELINLTVKIIKLTHNNVISILSGITAVFFVVYAMKKINIILWIDMILDLLENNVSKKYINLDDNTNLIEYANFMKIFYEYKNSRFFDKKIKLSRSDESLLYKIKFFNKYRCENSMYLGQDVINCLIMSYDTLLLCGDNVEKIIYYSHLIPGIMFSVNGYLGFLFGIMYGINNIPKNMIKFIESKF